MNRLPFLARQNFFENWVHYSADIPMGQKFGRNRSSHTVFKIQAFLCFAIFAKNMKIQNGRRFGEIKFFSKIGFTTVQRYPMGQRFHRNRSISHGFQDTGIFVCCNFCEKFENSEWLPFLGRQNFFENWVHYSGKISHG